MAPRGRTYTVSLPGCVTIEQQDLWAICGTSQYDDASDSYSVDFKTWQVASRYQNNAAWKESCLAWNSEAATRSENGAAYLAAKLPSCTAAVSAVLENHAAQLHSRLPSYQAAQLQSAQAPGLLLSPPGLNPVPPPQCEIPMPFIGTLTQHVVMLHALPPRLMQKNMLNAMLEQGGLEAKLLGISVSQNPNSGEVEITFSSKDAAELCQKQFHHPKWNQVGTAEVIVRKQGQGGSSKHSAPPVMDNHATQNGRTSALYPSRSGGPSQSAPAYVHSMLGGKKTVPSSSRTRTGTSDASTTVSDEEEWCLGELSRELNL